MLTLANVVEAAPSNQTISFSARLKNSSGGVVADGYYNIGFRLYSQSTGGSAIWTEIYHDANGPAAGQDNRIKVSNGYFSVKLGSLEQFTGVDWSGDLFLTMDIGGTAQEATIANIDWDGEMTPRIQLSAMPYAMNAQMLGGKTADDFFQIGNGVQDSGSNASIAINKTGTGDLVNLQSSGTDVFTLSGSGSITMGSLSSQSISVADSATGAGQSLTLAAGSATSGDNDGGDLVLQAGSGSGTGSDGVITMASSVSVGAGKTITMVGGATSLRPASPDEGTIYFDTDTKQLMVYAGSKWQPLNGGGASMATKVVAASDSPQAIKSTADYVADGTADQVEINAALTAAAGGNVYLAEGTYTTNAAILIPNNTTLQGAGNGSKIQAGINSKYDLIENGDKTTGTGIRVHSLKLDGRRDLYPVAQQQGIHFQGMQNGEVSGVTFTNFTNWAIRINNSTSNRITNNSFGNNQNGIIVMSNSTNNTINNNIFDGDETGLAIEVSDSSNNSISNNVMRNWLTGINVSFSSSLIINGNKISDTVSSGIILYEEMADTTVSNNHISEPGGSANNHGIYLDSTYAGNKVIGNHITDTAHSITNDALYLDGDGIYVADNMLNGGGIYDRSSNTIYANQRDASGKLINRSSGGFGVQTSTGSDAMTIDATTGDIAVAGTLEAGSIETAAVDTSSAGTLAIGANNATSVTIGTSDTAATLLVLDTKTSAGDPSGAVNGAMYYNSDAGKFRCYQAAEWVDCVTPLPVAKRVDAVQSLSNGSVVDVEGLSFTLAPNTKYHYKFVTIFQSNSQGAGIGQGVTFTNPPVSNNYCVNVGGATSENTAGMFASYCGVGDAVSDASSAFVEAAATSYPSTMEGYIETGNVGDTLQLRAFRKGQAGDVISIQPGSFGVLQIVE